MAELTAAEEKAAKAEAEKEAKAKAEGLKSFEVEAKKPGRYVVGENLVDGNNKIIAKVPEGYDFS